MSAILAIMIGMVWAQADVEVRFMDNQDGRTATLTFICPNGKETTATVERKRLDMMNIDAIYAFIDLNCKDQRRKL
jgi:hypothetical protein